MLHFFKVLLRGILTTVLLPLILVVWAGYAVYCLIAFIITLIKSLIYFFAGDSASGEMKEDIEAKRILLEREQAVVDANSMLSTFFSGVVNQQQAAGSFPPQQQMQGNPIQNSNYPMHGGINIPTNDSNLNNRVNENTNQALQPQTQEQPASNEMESATNESNEEFNDGDAN